MIKPINVSKKLSDGREVSIETGKLAKQADGSVVLTMGKTMILASVVSKKDAMDNVDFLPLSVDYQSEIIDLRSKQIEFPNGQANDINKIRNDFILGKNFDYRYSVIDLLFLRGPESGYLIRNFKKNI